MKETLQLVGSATAFFSQGLCLDFATGSAVTSKNVQNRKMENIHRILCIYRKMNKLILHLPFFDYFEFSKLGPKRAQLSSIRALSQPLHRSKST
jgi:hypothetical protein